MKPLKKASHAEVHWQLPTQNAGNQANQRIREWLGNALAERFAPVQMANNQYVWYADNKDEWRPISAAIVSDNDDIASALLDLHNKVTAKLADSPQIAESILTTPNKDFIFYKRVGNDIILMVTGWACKNKNNATGFFIEKKFSDDGMQKVVLSFSREGHKLPHHPFVNNINGASLSTNEEGVFIFDKKIKIGQPLSVTEKVSGQFFQFAVEEGKENYDFDLGPEPREAVIPPEIPRPAASFTPVIKVIDSNALAVSGYPLKIFINGGDETTLISDPLGRVMLSTLPEGTVIDAVEANNPNHRERYTLTGQQWEFVFPVQAETMLHISIADTKGVPVPQAQLRLSQGDFSVSCMTDGNGKTEVKKRDFTMGAPVNALISFKGESFPPAVFSFDERETEYVLQEAKKPSRTGQIIALIAIAVGTLAATLALNYGIIEFNNHLNF